MKIKLDNKTLHFKNIFYFPNSDIIKFKIYDAFHEVNKNDFNDFLKYNYINVYYNSLDYDNINEFIIDLIEYGCLTNINNIKKMTFVKVTNLIINNFRTVNKNYILKKIQFDFSNEYYVFVFMILKCLNKIVFENDENKIKHYNLTFNIYDIILQ